MASCPARIRCGINWSGNPERLRYYDGLLSRIKEHDSYGFLDLDNVKRIEFVSGAASALYGSGAMAGIINIITKEAEDVNGLQLTGRGGRGGWSRGGLYEKKDYTSPTVSGELPDDMPMPGINFFLELRYTF